MFSANGSNDCSFSTKCVHRTVQLIGRHRLVDEPNVHGLLRGAHLVGHEELPGSGEPDPRGPQQRAAVPRRHRETGQVGITEGGVIRRVYEVTRQGHRGAEAGAPGAKTLAMVGFSQPTESRMMSSASLNMRRILAGSAEAATTPRRT